MTSRAISPVIRALAPAAAPALLLSACGGSEGAGSFPTENEEGTSAEVEAQEAFQIEDPDAYIHAWR